MSQGKASEEALIQFYQVDFCGYYDKRPLVYRFGSLAGVIPQLKLWAVDQNPPVQQTKTYPPDIQNRYLESYCLAVKDTPDGDYFITLWIRTEADDENMLAAINGDSAVQTPSIRRNVLKETDLPGIPAYFWVLPKENLIAVLRFGKNKLVHISDFCRYLRGYLSIWIKELRKERSGKDLRIKIQPEMNLSLEDLSLKVEVARVKHRGNEAKIRANIRSIKRLIRKKDLEYARPDHKSKWRKLRTFFGLGPNLEAAEVPREISCRIELECPIPPTPEELDAIIADFESDKDGFSDVGFALSDSNEERHIEWLSRSYSRETIDVDVARTDGIVSLTTLAESLAPHRAKLIAAAMTDIPSAQVTSKPTVRRRKSGSKDK